MITPSLMLQLIEYLKNSRLVKITLLIVIISIAVISLISMQIAALKPKIIESQKIDSQKSAIIKNYKETLYELSENLKEKITTLKSIRPDEDGIIGFIEKTEELVEKSPFAAKCTNCQLDDYFNIKHAGSQAAGNNNTPNSVNYAISLKADLGDLIDFLKKFEQLPYVTAVENVGFNRYEANGSHNIQLKITLFIK